MVKVAINGYGRIGRVAFRAAIEKYGSEIEIVAINTSGSMEVSGWANLTKYDTVYGRLNQEIAVDKEAGLSGEIGSLLIGSKRYPFLAQKDPAKIPWERYNVDVVLECTGVFRKTEECKSHLKAGAKKVIISAPAKDDTPTYVLGVNQEKYSGEKIISNASCTTNCIAPIAKVMNDSFKISRSAMTTIHAYTADQELVDGSHKDLRRARGAAANIIPTSTGAAEALARVIPAFKDKFEGLAIRVPVACGSLADFNFVLEQNVRLEKINNLFEQMSYDPRYEGIIGVSNDPLVSSDIIGSAYSTIIDLLLTSVTGGNLVKITAWYDNEWGYSCRLLEMAKYIWQHD